MELTSELLARASSTSEVLTLNLTNLIILILLKAIVFGMGMFSVGSVFSARSTKETSIVSKSDLSGGMCFILYASGAEEKLSCIQRTACEDPKTASEYATAAKMVHKVHKMVGVNFSSKYSIAVDQGIFLFLCGSDERE